MKILSVGIHIDDCESGMGGLAAMLAARGAEVTFLNIKPYMHYKTPNESANAQSMRGAEILGAQKIILDYEGTKYYKTNEKTVRLTEEVICDIRPDVVFMMHPKDAHIEHVECARTAREALFAAAVDGIAPNEVYSFESGPLQTMQYFIPDFYIDIAEGKDKLAESLRNFGVQNADGEKLWDTKRVCAEYRGQSRGIEIADAFKIMKFPEGKNPFMLFEMLRGYWLWGDSKMYYTHAHAEGLL